MSDMMSSTSTANKAATAEEVNFADAESSSSARVKDGMTDDSISIEDTDSEDVKPEGLGDLHGSRKGEESSPFSTGGQLAEKTRLSFFERTSQRAEASALRTRYDENDSFLLVDEAGHDDRNKNDRVPSAFRHHFGGSEGSTALASFSKRVTANLDSDDELIMACREKKWTDQEIADRLANEGRIKYDRKTISTRINRIKAAQAAQVDMMLAEGSKEWTFAEDTLLMHAYDLADKDVNFEIDRIHSWRFRKVAEHMRRMSKDAIFSDKACKNRYDALVAGTATLPTELDDNPEQRLRQLDVNRQERERIREVERIEKEKAADLVRKVKEEAKLRNLQKLKASAISREETQRLKAEKALQRAAQAQTKYQQALAHKEAKIRDHEQLMAKKAAEDETKLQAIEESNKNTLFEVDATSAFNEVKVHDPDPRSYLSITDLAALCSRRALPTGGNTKAVFLERLRHADDLFSMKDLQTMCRAKGLSARGNKTSLKCQLADAEACQFASYEKGVREAEEVIAKAAEADDAQTMEGVQAEE